MEHECIIGMWWDYADTTLATLAYLRRNVPSDNLMEELNETSGHCLQKFEYCPTCGKKIDWKGLREKYGKAN